MNRFVYRREKEGQVHAGGQFVKTIPKKRNTQPDNFYFLKRFTNTSVLLLVELSLIFFISWYCGSLYIPSAASRDGNLIIAFMVRAFPSRHVAWISEARTT